MAALDFSAYVTSLGEQACLHALTARALPHTGQTVEWGHVLCWLARDQALGLRKYFQRETVPQGTVLIHQGAPADDLFVLESGRLEVEATSPEGTRVRLSSASSGVMFGEVAWYLGGQRTADVIAGTECEVLRLSRASISSNSSQECVS